MELRLQSTFSRNSTLNLQMTVYATDTRGKCQDLAVHTNPTIFSFKPFIVYYLL